MDYGICNLSIVPLRLEASDTSEMVSQVLYGEFFEVTEKQPKWSRIKLHFDGYEGWIDNKQFLPLSEETFISLTHTPEAYAGEFIDFITTDKQTLLPVCLGSTVSSASNLQHLFEGVQVTQKATREKLVQTAMLYLNAPYLWGGKTPFGIDCSGFSQMVFKLSGYALLRDASQQATQGEALSFLEESLPGDVAFFDNEEGNITHVGIILKNNQIIHASGKVRIDQLDHSGIFNTETKKHTHTLRVIKRIIDWEK